MQFKVKLLSFNEPASDSSRVSREIVEQFMATETYKNAIASHSMLGTMSHYPRNAGTGTKNLNPAISKTVGKDDLMIIVGEAAPTHYITGLECGSDGWLYAYAKLLDEKNFDTQAAENIKRLKGLLSSGCLIGCSAVILGYWDSTTNGDILKKMVNLKGFDLTLNPSWKKAQVVSVADDDGNIIADVEDDVRTFSENSEVKYEGMKVKTFSDISSLGFENIAKSSKIGGKYTVLKAKEFSANNNVEFVDEEKVEEKTYSAATIRERLRLAKFSPRMRFRRLFLDYKQLVKQLGGQEKMKPEELKILKSMFTSDCLDIFKTITQDIGSGKQINVLIGGSSLGKQIRIAAQKLQIPYKMAWMEMNKKGYLSPMRMKNLQAAYTDFIQAMVEEVFGPNPIPEGLEDEINEQENEKGGVKRDEKKNF